MHVICNKFSLWNVGFCYYNGVVCCFQDWSPQNHRQSQTIQTYDKILTFANAILHNHILLSIPPTLCCIHGLSMVQCKTAVFPLLTHCGYCSVAVRNNILKHAHCLEHYLIQRIPFCNLCYEAYFTNASIMHGYRLHGAILGAKCVYKGRMKGEGDQLHGGFYIREWINGLLYCRNTISIWNQYSICRDVCCLFKFQTPIIFNIWRRRHLSNMSANHGIWQHLKKLDESTARRQLKSPRSLSGRSIPLALVTKWPWLWSRMTYFHHLCAMSISPPILRYSFFKIWPWKSMVKAMCVVKVKVTFELQISKVNVMVKVKPIGHIEA